MQITWLGQSGFICKCGNITLVFDPYLTDSCSKRHTLSDHTRCTPIKIKPLDLLGVDGVFISHDHADHYDLETIEPLLNSSQNTKFFGPPCCSNFEDYTQWNAAHPGKLAAFDRGNVEVWAIPAAHEELRRDANGDFECLSYIVLYKAEKIAFFAAGDTLIYPGQAAAIKQITQDFKLIMALPVNGRDEERHARNIIGNMNYSEALILAKDTKAYSVISSHYGMFLGNDPQETPCINDWKNASINLLFIAPFSLLSLR